MSRPARIDVFCEDRAHEEFLKPLLRRTCTEKMVDARIEVRAARGGRARVFDELSTYHAFVRNSGRPVPDLLVVAIDANCSSYATKAREVRGKIDTGLFPHHAVACPDPHIERWYMADAEAFQQVVGVAPLAVQPKCDKQTRNVLKKALVDSVKAAGHPTIFGGIDFAADLVRAMDTFRAGKAEPGLKHFLEEVASALRQLKAAL
ncbi:MAG: hypothetical protein FJ291_18035 [Planctomycetes bacterium]|nr:hypothetical protein [Planctomycetota bacterium]